MNYCENSRFVVSELVAPGSPEHVHENINTFSEIVFCYKNCSDLLWEEIVQVTEKNIWNSRLMAENLQKKLRWLEQFVRTVKGQNNF